MHVAGLIRFTRGATFAFAYPRFDVSYSLLCVEHKPSMWYVRIFILSRSISSESRQKRVASHSSNWNKVASRLGKLHYHFRVSFLRISVFHSSFFLQEGFRNKVAITAHSTFHALARLEYLCGNDP